MGRRKPAADVSVITSKEVYSPIGPFSQGLLVDNWLFTAGIGGLDKNGQVVSDHVKEQAAQMMQNVNVILSRAGMSFQNVVKVTLYLTSMADYEEVNRVYQSYLAHVYPARTCVEVSGLPAREKVKLELIARR